MKGLMRTHSCGELSKEQVGLEVTLCGWVNKYRDLGALHFIDLRDKTGMTQLSFDQFKLDLALLKKCSLESVIKVKGRVRARPVEAINSQMSTGQIEIAVEYLEVLSQADTEHLPFLPFGAIPASDDLKLKYRYLDLRTHALQNMLQKRSHIMSKVRSLLTSWSFVEVETPILYKSTPEGARDYVVPSRVHPKHVYALPQSPQTLKQLLMIGGTDRYFQLCRCFRDEDLRSDRQPEFTQIDIEASFINADFIKELATALMKTIYDLPQDFVLPTMSYAEAMRRFGSDKPDLRFDLEHLEVTDLFKESSFGTFQEIANNRGLIKAIFVPESMGKLTRKQLDGLVDVVKPYGGKGVAWFNCENKVLSGGISKFISPEILSALQSHHQEEQNGVWLFCAHPMPDVTHACANAVRLFLGETFKLKKEGYHFLWVYDFPLLEWSEDHSRFFARHHPFTMPKKEFIEAFLAIDRTDVYSPEIADLPAEAYDLVCNGYELGGGSLRIYDQSVQSKMFEVLGMSEEEAKTQFGFFLEALKYGTPPHGGIAFGLDRIMMILLQTEFIKEVIAFPKTNSDTDLMSQAPSKPNEAQLKELHFKWN